MSLEDNNLNERRDYYSRIASEYEKCALEQTGYLAHKVVPNRVLQLLSKEQLQSSLKVLDLGCGTGLGSLLFFEKGFDVTGMDFSQGMLEECKKRPFKQLICQNINEDLAAPEAAFEIVICLGTFEFVEDPLFVFKQVEAVLKPGGLFAFTIPTSKEPCERLKIKYFTVDGIKGILAQTSLEIIETQTFFGWETGHLQTLDGKPKGEQESVEYAAFYLKILNR